MVGRIGDITPPIAGPGGPGGATAPAQGGKDFASFVKEAGGDMLTTMYTGEEQAMKGISGEADLNDVVAAVNDAEMTLQTITALRDRLVQAYQEIIRMPI
ncbi:MAG: flagellar hook-basal body complex protein FliE [Alphaproteobacteria bacterium]|nr:flagellar hook-basal body complex protein FliE [Alphaproteobacteria bacterium]